MKTTSYVQSLVIVCSAALLSLFPSVAHAQWENGAKMIVNWNPNFANSPGSTVSPSSSSDSANASKPESKSDRADGGLDTGGGASYTCRQIYTWARVIQGPPSPSFRITVDAAISGSATPPSSYASENQDENVSQATAASQAGGLYKECSNAPVMGQSSSCGDSPRDHRSSDLVINHNDGDIFTAYCDITMAVGTTANATLQDISVDHSSDQGHGLANHAVAKSSINFGAPQDQ